MIGPQRPTTPPPSEESPIYSALHGKGMYLTTGEKFGGHYLAYPGDPLRYHSSFVVHRLNHAIEPKELIAKARLANSSGKNLLLAAQDGRTEVVSWSPLNNLIRK